MRGETARGGIRVLGIDPGTAVTGWGVVERGPGGVRHVEHGTVRTDARARLPEKLACIHDALAGCCARFAPDVLALEKSFVGRNVQSAFRLGEVRGVAMLVAAVAGLPVAEYSPAEIKIAVAGSGRADKTQVARAIARELGIEDAVTSDAADALALALCHVQGAALRACIAGAGARPTTVSRGVA